MSAPITEAHYDLRRQVRFSDADEGAELIADSEARATERLRKEIDWLQLNNDMLTDDPEKHARAIAERQAIIDERDQLRAEVERLKRDYEYDHKCLCEVRDRCELWKQRAERAEAEVKQLKADGAASAFVDMSCRASRAEADRNNLRADLDAIKSILNKETNRAEKAEHDCRVLIGQLNAAEAELKEWSRLTIWGGTPGFIHAFVKRQQARVHAAQDIEVELAAERARLDWLEKRGPWESWNGFTEIGITLRENIRAAIDAAMKEGAK